MVDAVIFGFIGAQCLGGLYFYSKSLKEYKSTNVLRNILVAIFIIFSCVIFKYEKNYFNYMALVLGTNFLVAALVFNGKLKAIIAVTVFFTMCLILAEMGTVYLVEALNYYVYLGGKYSLMISVGISRIVLLAVVFYGVKIFAFEKDITKNKQFWIMFISLALTCGFVSVVFAKINRELLSASQLIWCIFGIFGILLLSVVCFFVLSKIMLLEEEKTRLDMAENRLKVESEYNSLIEERYREAKMVIHDAEKHIKNMEDLGASNEGELILIYKNQLLDVFKSQEGKKLTGNKLVDIILERKFVEAKNNSIEMVYDIEPVRLNEFSEMDLGTVFNNVLDNAIEAAKISDKKYVKLWLYDTNEAFTTIKIINSYTPENVIKKNKSEMLFSEHGYGIESVKKVIETLGGTFDMCLDSEKNEATTIVMMGYN